MKIGLRRENGFLLLVVAMTVGQFMTIIGFMMIVAGFVEAYTHRYLHSNAVQCQGCQAWFDIEWLRCPQWDKLYWKRHFHASPDPHIITVAIPTPTERPG